MIPREAPRGTSFKGAGLYYLHDKNADTAERVAFTHTENLPTKDPDKALKWMAWTAMHAEDLKEHTGESRRGRKSEKPVYSFSLAWHPEEKPEQWEMIVAARHALEALGLRDRETLMVGHSDRDHPHLHVIVNLVHPETGRSDTLKHSRRKLSRWAEEYERDRGKIYCEQRVENNAKREQGQIVVYEEKEIDIKARITQAYFAADSGKAFRAALEEHGYKLAKDRRLLVIDASGKIHSLSRNVQGASAKDIKAKLADLALPHFDEARGEGQGDARKQKPEYFDRDKQDQDWQERVIDAGIAHDDKVRAEEKRNELLNRLQNRHLAELGFFYARNQRKRDQLEFTLDNQYGASRRQMQRDADELQAALDGGRVKLWWMKLTGKVPVHTRQELDAMRKTIGNIDWRRNEAQQGLEARIAEERAELAARHGREREALQPKPEPQRQPERQPENQHGPDSRRAAFMRHAEDFRADDSDADDTPGGACDVTDTHGAQLRAQQEAQGAALRGETRSPLSGEFHIVTNIPVAPAPADSDYEQRRNAYLSSDDEPESPDDPGPDF